MGAVQAAVVERVSGGRPSRTKSLIAAGVVGFAAAVATFRLLRSGSSQDEDEDGDDGG